MITDKMVEAALRVRVEHRSGEPFFGGSSYDAERARIRVELEAADRVREEDRLAFASMAEHANAVARTQWPSPPEETK